MPFGVTAAATVGAAALGAGASIYGANKAAGAAKDAANENNALEQEIYDKNTANLTPWMTRGNTAADQYDALLGIGGDPTAATNGLNNYLNSSGYKFQVGQGVNALDSTAASRGLLNSGANLKNISNFGQQTGQNYLNTYLGDLSGVSGQGLAAGNALAGVGTNYASAVSDNNNSAASAVGNSYGVATGQISNLLGQAAMTYGLRNTGSSYNAGGAQQAYDQSAAEEPPY